MSSEKLFQVSSDRLFEVSSEKSFKVFSQGLLRCPVRSIFMYAKIFGGLFTVSCMESKL